MPNGDDGVGGDESGDDNGSSNEGNEDTGGVSGELDPTALLSSEDILKRGRELAQLGVPLQLGGLLEALAQLRARSQGSTASIFPAIISQLGDLRTQYAQASQALGRRLGVAGGGFATRGKTQLLEQTGTQYARLIGQGQQAGFAGLLNTLANVQPFLGANARPPSVSERPGAAPNFALQGEGLVNATKAFQRIFGGTSQPNYLNNVVPYYATQSPLGGADFT